MIRNWDANETGPLLELWLESTIHAHPFIAESYWHDSLAIVRDVYLPSAQTWVWEQDGVLKGFISVMSHASSARCSSRRMPPGRASAAR